MLLAIAFDQAHRIPVAELAPKLLLEQLGVAGDHVVGRAQDAAGRAVVLLERDHFQIGPILRQALKIGDGRAAPAVDALVVVAHRGEQAAPAWVFVADQQLEQLVLHRVGVLVLIDQHMAKAALPLGARLFVAQQQLQGQADQVVEIDRLVSRQPVLVELHHPCRDLLVGVLGDGHRGLAVQPLVLPQADGPLPLPRQLVVARAPSLAQHAHHIVGIQDRVLLLQADLDAVLAQDAHAQAVEGADRQVLGSARADQALGTLAHLLRRFVGEGDRGDLLRCQAGLQQAGDLVHDHPGLARPGASQHQARPREVVNSLQLGGVE